MHEYVCVYQWHKGFKKQLVPFLFYLMAVLVMTQYLDIMMHNGEKITVKILWEKITVSVLLPATWQGNRQGSDPRLHHSLAFWSEASFSIFAHLHLLTPKTGTIAAALGLWLGPPNPHLQHLIPKLLFPSLRLWLTEKETGHGSSELFLSLEARRLNLQFF